MKTTILALSIMAGFSAIAQTNQPAVEDFKPSSLNQPGKQYPQVNSERRVRARVVAPQAQSVLLDIGAVKYPLTKGEDGAWVGDQHRRMKGSITISSWSMGPPFRTLAAFTSTAPAGGAVASKSPPRTRTSMR